MLAAHNLSSVHNIRDSALTCNMKGKIGHIQSRAQHERRYMCLSILMSRAIVCSFLPFSVLTIITVTHARTHACTHARTHAHK